jgi:glycosyltransferase involved in cell wall biosynthesis
MPDADERWSEIFVGGMEGVVMSPQGSFRVAVITPYYREAPGVLHDCLASVARQTHPCTHFLVADGHPQDLTVNWPVEHIILPRAHRDVGNTARAIGSLSAMNQGFDAIAFLDADNWYYPQHIELLVALHRATGAVVCSATRTIHRLDGSLMYQDGESNGRDHVDTSCLFLVRPAFRVLPVWAMMPPQLGPLGDRFFWRSIQGHGYRTAHSLISTVGFRTHYQVHYQVLGERPPPGTKSIAETTGVAYRWWMSLPAEERDSWSRYLGMAPL